MDHTLYISEGEPIELQSNVSYIKPRNFCKENENLSWQDVLVNGAIKDVVINYEGGVYEGYVKNYSDLMKYVIEEVLSLLDNDGYLSIITDSLEKKQELLELLHYHERHTFIIQDKFSLIKDYNYSNKSHGSKKYVKKLHIPHVTISYDRQINGIVEKRFDEYVKNL